MSTQPGTDAGPRDASRIPRVVVVGAGFGGLAAIRRLKRAPVDVVVVDRTANHLFQPLLYQVATAVLSPGEIAPPIRGILRRQRNATVLLGNVTGFDLEQRRVTLTGADGSSRQVAYDYLVVAAGATDSYFGHDEWAPHLFPMKTIDQAVSLRSRTMYCSGEPSAARKTTSPSSATGVSPHRSV